ncbi:MAG: heme biosynthesis HemY N-terminal domain-containing protein [Sneathiella sp.]
MIRSLYLFILFAIIAVAGVWLTDHPGQVSINWDSYVIETNIVVLVVTALLAGVAITLLYRLFLWLKNSPARLGGALSARKRSKGLEALSSGMVAIAAGDAREARLAAIEAEKHLKNEPMALLLAAQAAELNEDDRAARIYYDKLAARSDTEFLGIRGLIARAKADNDLDLALKHATRADELKPGTEWVLKDLFELSLKARQFEKADALLDRMTRGKASKSAKVKRLHAVIGYARATGKIAQNDQSEATRLALLAHAFDPTFVPASVLAIGLMDAGRKRDKLIQEAWDHAPHPDIAATVKGLVKDETPADWYIRAKKIFAGLQPNHRETALVLARASFDAREWGNTRTYLDLAIKADPSASVYLLRANFEEKANADAAAARSWILKSAEAAPDPHWICDSCGRQETQWSSHCPACDSFDSQQWRKADIGLQHSPVLEAEIVPEIAAPA